jgi:hypothetical protein
MRSGLNLGNPVLAAAFRSALLHQGLVALLIFGVLTFGWVIVREWRPAGPGIFGYSGGGWHQAGPALPAALARRRVGVLRLSTAGSRITALLTAPAAPERRLARR